MVRLEDEFLPEPAVQRAVLEAQLRQLRQGAYQIAVGVEILKQQTPAPQLKTAATPEEKSRWNAMAAEQQKQIEQKEELLENLKRGIRVCIQKLAKLNITPAEPDQEDLGLVEIGENLLD